MPELPDVNLYVLRLKERLVGQSVESYRVLSPFVLRSAEVPLLDLKGATLIDVFRLGKRIVLAFERDLYLVLHLMIAGRLSWDDRQPPAKPSKIEQFRMVWTNGVLALQEASKKKRAGIWLVRGAAALDDHKREGLDVLSASAEQFKQRLQSENRSLKRALTDPNSFDGIGNAYSDEILFQARLSPLKLTQSLDDDAFERLRAAAQSVLVDWSSTLESQYPAFPKPSQITAFRKEFFVHGRFGEACRVCNAPIQRIVAQENEINYCARCQNDGKILADRSLSRLLKDDWPKTIDQLLAEE